MWVPSGANGSTRGWQWRGRVGESSNPLFRGFNKDIPEETQQYDEPVLVRLNTASAEELRGGFPSSAEELFPEYRSIILDDLEESFFTQEQQELIDRFVAAHGPRDPAYPKPLAWSTDGDIRVGQITVSEKEFSDAELSWWTLWNRHFEDDVAYDPKATDHWGWGGAGWDGGFPTWTFATDGKSKSRTKLRGEMCEDANSGTFRPASCDASDDAPAQVCTLNRDTPLSPLPPSSPPTPSSPPKALTYYRESGQAISSNSVSISYGGAAASSKLYASDIAPGASLLHECAATCDTEPSCVAFVHDFGSNPHCVFKKVTTLADGKNHGLIFVLDWSGSMSKVMLDTIKQLYNLIWFCKKVSIPFEVYAFTNEWKKPEINYETQEIVKPADWTSSYEKKENLLAVHEQFSMMNLLTSKTNGKQLEHQMINIWRCAKAFGNFYGSCYGVPTRLGLSGTPLNEAFVCLHQILPQFQKENKLQKVQCIVLTDGEANHLSRHVMVKRHWENEPYMGTRQLNGGNTFLRDRKTGNTYQVPFGWHGFSDLMLQNLRDNFPTVNFVGIRVVESRDANGFFRLYHDQNSDAFRKLQNEWKKQRSCTIKTSGYHAYFAMSASSLSQDADFEVDDGATKAKIKSAFIKSLKTKKLNKKVLGEFISLVA